MQVRYLYNKQKIDLENQIAKFNQDLNLANERIKNGNEIINTHYERINQITETLGGIAGLMAGGGLNTTNLIGTGVTLLGLIGGGLHATNIIKKRNGRVTDKKV